MRGLVRLALAAASCAAVPLQADTLSDFSADFDSVEMYLVDETGPGQYIGNIDVRATQYGVVFDPQLSDLEPGLHGFHVHTNPSCEPNVKDAEHRQVPAGAAGDHFDPKGVAQHGSPWDISHIGDLPMLYVNDQGEATHAVLAPRVEMEFLQGRSLIIHANPDNYSDTPPKGGSGPRVACGVLFDEAMESEVTPDNTERNPSPASP